MRRIPGLVLGLALVLAAAVPAASSAFPDEIALPDGFAPEGITSHGTTLYVGSLVDGAIWRGDLHSGTGSVWIDGMAGRVAVGIDHDAVHDRLWVAGGNTHEVRAYDATTGELLETYTVDSGFLNDVVATDDAVYVTDSNIQQLIVIPLGADGSLPVPADATTIPLTGDIAYAAGFNANGITEARGTLILVQSNLGRVFTVDPATGVATAIELSGPEGSYAVTAGDGIEVYGNTLAVVRNQLNLVATFKLDGRLTSGTLVAELTSARFSVPTTATRAAGDLWVVNARFGTPVTPDTQYWITRVPGS
jgi:hypothetical protein